MREIIYFDNNATTRPEPEVVDAMARLLRDGYGNPSSVHQFGQAARYQVECAREQVAALVGASAKEIVFTSGGTESINLAIAGYLRAHPKRRRLVTTAVEHSAVLRMATQLEANGYVIEHVGVDGDGQIDQAHWEAALTEDTAFASIICANNETGVVWDVASLAAVARDRGIPVHVDAVQAAGKLDINMAQWPVDLLSISAHKLHGPKGAGALYVRRRTRLAPLLVGGSQERDLRGGTENVAGIVGMGLACETARSHMALHRESVGALRDKLERDILEAIPFAHVIGGGERVYNTTNIGFEGLEAEAILLLLSEAGVCASSGSACSSGSLEPSHVVTAMNVDPRIAHGAIRFSLSRFNTADEVDAVVEMMPGLLAKLTALSPR